MQIYRKIENNKLLLENLDDFIGKNVEIKIEVVKNRRTSQQNAALHLWFTQLSETLNNDGYDMRKLIRQEIDIMWTPYNVKEYLFRPIMKLLTGKKSTSQLTGEDINKIYDIINKTIGERTGIFIPFPSIDNLIKEN